MGLRHHLYRNQELSVVNGIETWYNISRTHVTLGYKTINEFELVKYHKNVAA